MVKKEDADLKLMTDLARHWNIETIKARKAFTTLIEKTPNELIRELLTELYELRDYKKTMESSANGN